MKQQNKKRFQYSTYSMLFTLCSVFALIFKFIFSKTAFACMVEEPIGYQIDYFSVFYYGITSLLAIAGLILGIISLVKKEKNSEIAIVSIIFASVALIPSIAIFIGSFNTPIYQSNCSQ